MFKNIIKVKDINIVSFDQKDIFKNVIVMLFENNK